MNIGRPRRNHSVRGTEDYLTARAANPRTGVISPSIHSSGSTPCVTPESPGKALEMYGIDTRNAAATAAAMAQKQAEAGNAEMEFPRKEIRRSKIRSLFRKAAKKKAENDRAGVENAHDPLPPDISIVDMQSDMPEPANPSRRPSAEDNEDADRFIFPMPSALEPQPYKYSPKQREAYSYYLQKTWSAQDAEADVLLQRSDSGGPLQRPSTETYARTPMFERPLAGATDRRKDSWTMTTQTDGQAVPAKNVKRKELVVDSKRNSAASFRAIKWMRQSDWSRLPRVALIHPSDAASPRPLRTPSPLSSSSSLSLSSSEESDGKAKVDVDVKSLTGSAALPSNVATWLWTMFVALVLQLFCTLPKASNLWLLTQAFDVEKPGEVRFQSLKTSLATAAHIFIMFYALLCLYETSRVVLEFVWLVLFPLKLAVRVLWWMVES